METNKLKLNTRNKVFMGIVFALSLLMLVVGVVLLSSVQDTSSSVPSFVIEKVATAEGDTVISGVTNVFTEIGDWIVTSLGNVVELFYDNTANEFTFLGILSLAGLSVSVFFLIMGVIQNFLHFRS